MHSPVVYKRQWHVWSDRRCIHQLCTKGSDICEAIIVLLMKFFKQYKLRSVRFVYLCRYYQKEFGWIATNWNWRVSKLHKFDTNVNSKCLFNLAIADNDVLKRITCIQCKRAASDQLYDDGLSIWSCGFESHLRQKWIFIAHSLFGSVHSLKWVPFSVTGVLHNEMGLGMRVYVFRWMAMHSVIAPAF